MTGDRYAQMISDIMEYGDWGNLDYLVIDLPPGSSDIWKSVLSIFANVLLGDVIVVQPSMTDSAIRGLRLHKYYDIPVIGIVENMAYFKCNHDEIYYLFGKSSGEELAKQFNVPYLGAIPIIPDMNEKIDNGEVFIESEVLDNLAEKITTLEIPKTSFLERLKESVLKTIKEQIERVIAFIIVKTQKEIDAKGVALKYGFTEQRPFALTVTDESKQKIISRLFLKVKDGKLVVLSKPQTVDFEIVASFKTLARMIMGKAKVNGNIVPFDSFDAWACGDVVVYGTGFMPRAVSVLKHVFSDEQFLSEVRSKYGNILEQFI
jgi:MinD-like ATPase involved in chromosome partitioning or flagellar assembly